MPATEDAIGAKEVANKWVLKLMKEMKLMKKAHTQTLQARDTDGSNWSRLVASLQRREKNAKNKRDGLESRLQHLQSGQQKLQSGVSSMQKEIDVLSAGSEKDREY